jgi:hypothetical protein
MLKYMKVNVFRWIKLKKLGFISYIDHVGDHFI